jgi:hypothetical protein
VKALEVLSDPKEMNGRQRVISAFVKMMKVDILVSSMLFYAVDIGIAYGMLLVLSGRQRVISAFVKMMNSTVERMD